MKKNGNTLRNNLAGNLLKLRQKSGLSQVAFAKKMGVSTSFLSMLERGEREMSLSTVERTAKALKVPALTLLVADPKL